MACRCELRKKIKEASVPWIPERIVYLDYNATTPVDPRILGAVDRACRRSWGNPSSLHAAGTSAWNELEMLYTAAEGFFKVRADGFHFCSSGTEAISAALFGLAARDKNLNIITSRIEHQALTHPLFHLERGSPASPQGFSGRVIYLGVDSRGVIQPDELERVLKNTGRSVLVFSPVNHETGTVQPVETLAKTARKYGAYVILDAVQAAARMNPAEWAPHADIFCISGHKLYAPKGTALLWKNPDIRLRPVRFGGNQGGGLFPGTENIPGAAALAEALKLMTESQSSELRMLSSLNRDGLSILEKAGIEYIAESPADSAPGVLCISLNRASDMEDLLFGLNSQKICVSRFSACSEKLNGPSKILREMGRSEKRAGRSLRIAAGRWSRRDDYFKLAKALKQLLG